MDFLEFSHNNFCLFQETECETEAVIQSFSFPDCSLLSGIEEREKRSVMRLMMRVVALGNMDYTQ